MPEVLHFEPLFMERVWGGRKLAELFGKPLPDGSRVGESWEFVDRPEAQSLVASGSLKGVTLGELWTQHRKQIFGPRFQVGWGERFPLLIKLLDARDRLSVQVHPPASLAPTLGGEPKTEMWYFANCDPDAEIFAGLRSGVNRSTFEKALHEGTVATQVHRVPTRSGDSIFIPSGRIHAIGGGNVIIEVQQNSDTTYRVFDWNRVGLDGKPRDLHIEESLQCTDFDDIEPGVDHTESGLVANSEFFQVEKVQAPLIIERSEFRIIAVLEGVIRVGTEEFRAGHFFLVPAGLSVHIESVHVSSVGLLEISIP